MPEHRDHPAEGHPLSVRSKETGHEDLFAPPGTAWQRLSPSYLRMKLLLIPLMLGLICTALAVVAFLWAPIWAAWLVIALAVVLIAWQVWRAPRAYRRWGFAERDEDVYVTSGLWFRTLQCVPYGRMQLVEVTSGPIEQRFGLASVQMVTSSTAGTVSIPGLGATDAAALRDRLIARGEQQQAGI